MFPLRLLPTTDTAAAANSRSLGAIPRPPSRDGADINRLRQRSRFDTLALSQSRPLLTGLDRRPTEIVRGMRRRNSRNSVSISKRRCSEEYFARRLG